MSCQLPVLHEGRCPSKCCIRSHGSFLGALRRAYTGADRSSCRLLCISSFSLLLAFFPSASIFSPQGVLASLHQLGLLGVLCLALICGQTHILCIELSKKHHRHHRPWAETDPAPGSVARFLVCLVGSPCRSSSALDTASSSPGPPSCSFFRPYPCLLTFPVAVLNSTPMVKNHSLCIELPNYGENHSLCN